MVRLLLLAAILLAFARVFFQLDGKPLWWDESLTLQRAEAPLFDLLRGHLPLTDGVTTVSTNDQHPFFFFLVTGGLMQLAGDSEFVLRLLSAFAATLIVPVLWVMARRLAARHVVPPATAVFAVLLGATSPFLLWYGQEARPYALWACLALLATYLALRSSEPQAQRGRWLAGFVVVEAAFIVTHYYAIFLLPVHALIFFIRLYERNRRRALASAAVLLAVGSLLAAYGVWMILRLPEAVNFQSISLGILLPDLLNAFTMGLSVNIEQVWWIDLFFGLLGLLGLGYLLHERQNLADRLALPLAILVPILMLMLLNALLPLYMNARHMGILVGPAVLLVAAGVGVIHLKSRLLAWATTLFLLLAVAYSSNNYYFDETYAKDDYYRLDDYMSVRILPGDLVLYDPPPSTRIFEYYLPLESARRAQADGVHIAVQGVPLLRRTLAESADYLAATTPGFRRIWFVRSGTHPYLDVENQIIDWLDEQLVRVRKVTFFSQSSLAASLYIPGAPVLPAGDIENGTAVDVEFAGNVRLIGAALEPGYPGLSTPLRLYWQVAMKPERRLKYVVELLDRDESGNERVRATLEREPFEGDIPTTYWDPEKTIVEIVELPSGMNAPALQTGDTLWLTMQLYDAETLEKMPITHAAGGDGTPLPLTDDGFTVRFPVTVVTEPER